MKNSTRHEQSTDRSNAAMTFLETVRSRFPNTALLEIFNTCLSEYQEAVINLLLSEVASEAARKPERRKNDSSPAPLTHAQQVIADAQHFEQYQQALTTHLEARQRLKAVLRQLHALLQNQLPLP